MFSVYTKYTKMAVNSNMCLSRMCRREWLYTMPQFSKKCPFFVKMAPWHLPCHPARFKESRGLEHHLTLTAAMVSVSFQHQHFLILESKDFAAADVHCPSSWKWPIFGKRNTWSVKRKFESFGIKFMSSY